MLPPLKPRRVLMTIDAVGGVWRYALDLARAMEPCGVSFLLVGAGPQPDAGQHREADNLANVDLLWTDIPLDWMVERERDLDCVPAILGQCIRQWGPELLHLNLPSQAIGITRQIPLVVASHSCVPTWWNAMRDGGLPPHWRWQHYRNGMGFDLADRVVVPSASHGAAVRREYPSVGRLSVVYNSTTATAAAVAKRPFVFAAGRWWDDAKGGAVLDVATAGSARPVVMAGPVTGPNGEVFSTVNADQRGVLSADATLDLMRQAAIFAAPSRYEPFGLSVLEAASVVPHLCFPISRRFASCGTVRHCLCRPKIKSIS